MRPSAKLWGLKLLKLLVTYVALRYNVCFLMLLHLCPGTTVCVNRNRNWVVFCVYVFAYYYVCVLLILLYMCPYATTYVSSYYYICEYVSLYYCICEYVNRNRNWVVFCIYVSSYCYMCPYATTYVSSSYYYMSVLIPGCQTGTEWCSEDCISWLSPRQSETSSAPSPMQ